MTPVLRGKILGYAEAAQAGVIRTPDGDNFLFSKSDWSENSAPTQGMEVLFEGDRRNARQVRRFSIDEVPLRQKTRSGSE